MSSPAGAVAPAPRRFVLRVGPVSLQRRWRDVAVLVVLLLVAGVGLVGGLATGEVPIPAGRVLAWLGGQGETSDHFILSGLRLPRVLTGLLVGVALGMAGDMFVTVTRNPLATPDIVGITSGAGTAAVTAIVLGYASTSAVGFAALGGALTTGLLMYALAWRSGLSGYRLVLVGIGVGSLAQSLTTYLLAEGELTAVGQAVVWLTGSLNARTNAHAALVGVALLVLVPLAVLLTRASRTLGLGDDLATGLGVRVDRIRLATLGVAAALAAVGTAAAGPVLFVPLLATSIARRVSRASGPALGASAATGAALLLLCDLVARRVFAPVELPVGVVTGVLGGPLLLALLAATNRIRSEG